MESVVDDIDKSHIFEKWLGLYLPWLVPRGILRSSWKKGQ